MMKIIVDELLRSRLHDLSEPLELCDESGRVLGHVFPSVDVSAFEPSEPPVGAEELRRREQSGERRYSTAEVLAHLESL